MGTFGNEKLQIKRGELEEQKGGRELFRLGDADVRQRVTGKATAD